MTRKQLRHLLTQPHFWGYRTEPTHSLQVQQAQWAPVMDREQAVLSQPSAPSGCPSYPLTEYTSLEQGGIREQSRTPETVPMRAPNRFCWLYPAPPSASSLQGLYPPGLQGLTVILLREGNDSRS